MIGFIMHETKTNENNYGYILYTNFIKRFNDYCILGIPIQKIENIKKLIDLCDGIILQGGDSFDDVDIEIVKYLHQKDIPTLGICLGMQIMASSFNGIIKSIDNHKNKFMEKITVIKNTKLYDILKSDTLYVNSMHKDCVEQTNLDVSSYSNVIESIEDKDKKFFIGLQWHPEKLNDIYSNRIFDAFLKQCKK